MAIVISHRFSTVRMADLIVVLDGARVVAHREQPEEGDHDSRSRHQDTPARRAIVDFVQAVSTEGSPGFVAPAERVAVFARA